jgi:hypothetical protein
MMYSAVVKNLEVKRPEQDNCQSRIKRRPSASCGVNREIQDSGLKFRMAGDSILVTQDVSRTTNAKHTTNNAHEDRKRAYDPVIILDPHRYGQEHYEQEHEAIENEPGSLYRSRFPISVPEELVN